MADSLRETILTPDGKSVDIGMINTGGLRADLVPNEDGTITYAQTYEVEPFSNELGYVTLKGSDVKDALEQQWKTNLNTQNSRPMLKLSLSSNVRYTYDPAKLYGERITSVTINGEPLKADATYTVGSVTFLLAGGDSFEALTRGGAATTNGNLDRDSFNAYLGAHSGTAARSIQATVATDFATVVEAGDGLTIPVTCAGTSAPAPSPSADAANGSQSGSQAPAPTQHKNTKAPKSSLARTGADAEGLVGVLFVGAIGVAGLVARRRANRYQSENK